MNKTYKQFIGLLGMVILSFSCFSSCKVEPEEATIYLLKNQSGKDLEVNIFFHHKNNENVTIQIPNQSEIDHYKDINVAFLSNLEYPPPPIIDSVQVRYADGVTKSFQPYSADQSQSFNVMEKRYYNFQHLRAEVYRYTFTFTPEMYQYCKTNGYYTSE